MRIQHTETEVFRVYFRLGSDPFHFHHSYSSYSGYHAAVMMLKAKYLSNISEDLRNDYWLEIKVIWSPYPFCDDSETRVILQEAFNG